ncbi:MAG: GspE/PulE family protein [Pseudomonadota bacterium]|nr:GspE/PulE family protein [Pseudomonadota bacterium]MDP1903843.1 GspE/PulE family protein [Pseudomonadota bacterium]MDP2353659.1 GspE/PulE family protein [Pseudomonadota bacterium]
MARPEKIRLGDLLVQQKLLSQEQLGTALEKQKASGRKLGRVLVEHGFVTEDEISGAIARQLNIPLLDLRHVHVRPETVRLLPEQLARRFRAVVVEIKDDKVRVAMADPTDLFAYDEIVNHLKREVTVAVANEGSLAQFIDLIYRRSEEISELARNLTEELSDEVIDFGTLAATQNAEEAPVVRLLQSVFEDAIQVRASDIHVEPQEKSLQIRFRVDGVLSVATEADRKIGPALIQRLKLMADLDIAEKRLPQDGRFVIRLKKRAVDVRMSTVPVQFGESAVLRLLTHGGVTSLTDMQMPEAQLARLQALIHRPHGLILVTGPTGSGKTTTLYAALADLNTPERKLLTVEDPVEYRLPGINQVQVNDKIELTFARALRAFLRQDPDVILVGEMRDTETALIALRAALTGHLVLSTLHTNDAPSAAARLLDMGAPPFLLSTSLAGVVAQRLVRKLCPVCARPAQLDVNERVWMKTELAAGLDESVLKQARGCGHCNHTGYQGRQGIYELLEIDGELAGLLNRGDTSGFRTAAQKRLAGQTLRDEALRLVCESKTSVAEAMRVTHQVDE